MSSLAAPLTIISSLSARLLFAAKSIGLKSSLFSFMASTPSAVVQDVSLVLADAKIRAPWTAKRGLKAALSPRSAVYDFLACSIFCFS